MLIYEACLGLDVWFKDFQLMKWMQVTYLRVEKTKQLEMGSKSPDFIREEIVTQNLT